MNGQSGEATSQYRTRTLRDTVHVFLPDEELTLGIYFWWVVAADRTGRIRESDNNGVLVVGISAVPDTQSVSIPLAFDLLQNYPNPFNPDTRITYRLPVESHVRLAVFDTRGREIRILDEGTKPAGEHTVVWDGSGMSGERMSSGIYIVRLAAGARVFVQKILLVQ